MMKAEPDPDHSSFLAELLRAEAGVIASRAAQSLARSRPGLARRWGMPGEASREWAGSLHARVMDLAAALDASSPSLFAEELRWARQAFLAREAPQEDLCSGLDALRASLLDVVPPADRDQLAEYLDAGAAALGGPGGPPATSIAHDTPHGRLVLRFVLRVLEGDRRGAIEMVVSAVRDGALTVSDAHEKVLGPALREIGRMWHIGEINVAEEHFATGAALAAMAQLVSLQPRARETGRTVVVAAVAGNTHEIGGRMVADAFEAAGWRVISLGADVPAPDLAAAAADYRADAACLSVMLLSNLPALREAAAALVAACPSIRILAGGPGLRGLPDLALRHGAHALGATPEEAVRIAAALVERSR